MLNKPSAFSKSRTASHPLRVLVIFALGIIIPSGFLSFLGFRSLQIEGMLLHKQAEDRYAALADLMQRNINDLLNSLIQDLRKSVTRQAFQTGNLKSMTAELLDIRTVGGEPVRTLYLFDHLGHLVVPSLSSRGEKSPGLSSELDWGIFAEDLHRAERLEFVQKNVPQAIKLYLSLLEQVKAPALRAVLLKNIAGAYRKMGRYQEAEPYYQELIVHYDQLSDPSHLPLGLLGRQLLAQLDDASGQPDKARTTRLEIAEGLVVGQWTLPATQCDLLLGELQKSIFQNLPPNSPQAQAMRARWDRLQATASRLTALRAQAQAFLRESWPRMEEQIRRHGAWDQGGLFRSAASDNLYLAAPVVNVTGGGSRYLVLAAVEKESILQIIRRTLDKLMQSSGVRVEFGEADAPTAKGLRGLASSLQPRVVRALSLIDPPYEIRLLEDSRTQESLRRRWTWIYFGMIGLSILVIVVGLAVMAQAIRREIEVANMKADFVANVSHELRTPLSAISYIGERLSLGRYRSSEEVKEFYDMLGEETGRLRELIEDILDFSKMLDGRKAYTRHPTDLVQVAEEAIDRIRGKADSKGFQIRTAYPETPVRADIDRKSVLQAIMNLLDNAIKYSGDSREVRLRVDEKDGGAVVSVQDQGIGISIPDQAKIFEKFYRVEDAMTRGSEGGVGLGLAMVKHIVEGHGGTISVASAPGHGSTFTLWFPMKKESA